jgi:hypothetical protein
MNENSPKNTRNPNINKEASAVSVMTINGEQPETNNALLSHVTVTKISQVQKPQVVPPTIETSIFKID